MSSSANSQQQPAATTITLETKLHAINPASVKCQCKANEEKGQEAGMVTLSGDIAKQFQKLPLGSKITIQITQ